MKRAGKWLWGVLSAASMVQFAAWFLAAAVAILVAGYTNLPTGFRIALGVALFGFATCLLVALIPLLPASLRSKPKSARPPAAASSSSPMAQAALLQRNHDDKVVNERRALREIREELRDNRNVIDRAEQGETGIARHLSGNKWQLYEGTLLDIEDSAPHAAAREAYRELVGIERTEDTSGTDFPPGLLATDKATTLEAIDNAIKALDQAESKRVR